MKLSQYFKSGKGHGLLLVFCVTFLWSLALGCLTHYVGRQVIQIPTISDFINSIPAFEVKDGVIQNNNIRWAANIPMTQIPFIIDTTRDELNLPAPDGIYLSRKNAFIVAKHGMDITQAPLSGDQIVNPSVIFHALNQFVLVFAITIFIMFFIAAWLSYLISVAFTALFGWLIRATLAGGRVWRVVAVTWVSSFSLCIILSMCGFVVSAWIICLIATILSLVILKKITD